MKILIAPDKFKGSLTAAEAGAAIARGVSKQQPRAEIEIHPLADGGDGSLLVLREALALERIQVKTVDPLGRPLVADYYHDQQTAFIEVASASGIVLLDEAEKDPTKTSSYGTGLMIKDAFARGFNHIYLFLGGSATNDLGFGIASALGYQFLDRNDEALSPGGGNLVHLKKIIPPPPSPLPTLRITLLCDVKNPLYGPNGAAHVYAAQKGASSSQIALLDKGLQSSSVLLQQQCGIDVSTLAGGGAAGGIAAGLCALFQAKIEPGFEMISQLTGLETKLAATDLVISGEGKLDAQSLEGKVVAGVARLCRKHGKPLHLLVGNSELGKEQLKAKSIASVQTILSKADDVEDAMKKAAYYLEELARSLVGYS